MEAGRDCCNSNFPILSVPSLSDVLVLCFKVAKVLFLGQV
jgi:hypothetical protein